MLSCSSQELHSQEVCACIPIRLDFTFHYRTISSFRGNYGFYGCFYSWILLPHFSISFFR
nr:MAG TPA: hypothetical protein [Crassvirales sp.]